MFPEVHLGIHLFSNKKELNFCNNEKFLTSKLYSEFGTTGAPKDYMDASTPSYRKGEHKLSIFLQHRGHQKDHCRLYGDYHQSIS